MDLDVKNDLVGDKEDIMNSLNAENQLFKDESVKLKTELKKKNKL